MSQRNEVERVLRSMVNVIFLEKKVFTVLVVWLLCIYFVKDITHPIQLNQVFER